GCLFAVLCQLDQLTIAVLAVGLLLVCGHVLGNSLGTRLRDETTRQLQEGRAVGPEPTLPPVMLAPGRLAVGRRPPRGVLHATLGGSILGATVGGTGLARTYPDAPASAIVLAVVSSAILGGFAGFGASSFASVMRQALAEAWQTRNPAPYPVD